jgi:predicted RNA-binding Zn-ribbon protein involved in translation (DUF1610 family)
MIFQKIKEEQIVDIQFNVHKFSSKPKPDNIKQVLIISCFSEFGCETLGILYCIPRIIEENKDKYIIVVGWYGRSYFYRHLADEFWEVKEEYQWLRDKSLAFHHNSKNLKKIEKVLAKYGQVMASGDLGKLAVGNRCKSCDNIWGHNTGVICPKCGKNDITAALFGNVRYWKQRMHKLPEPSEVKKEEAKKFLGLNPVGVIARNRSTYGRNLQPEFYVKLVDLLQKMNYTPIWLGEKQSTLECPVPGIIDITRMPEARDLELTFAIVSQLEFTIQFWTASTRLAGMLGVPYLLFESPDQLFGAGQEAYRMALCTFGHKKLVLSHYLKVLNDHEGALNLVEKCINEMRLGDWSDVVGMVDEPMLVRKMRNDNLHRLAGI